MLSSNKKATFKRTEDKKSINQIVGERLLSKTLIIQLPSIEEKYAEILKVTDDGIAVNFKNFVPPVGTIILTGFIDNFYTEIEVNVLGQIKESLFSCKPKYLRISSQRRIEPRYTIVDDDEIFIKRIRISKSELHIRGNTIPIAYKVIMDKYTKEKADLADIVNISTFEKKSAIHQEIERTGKTLYIPDIRSNDLFEESGINEDLIDLKNFYGESLSAERKKMIDKNIIGRIISPIFGPQSNDMWIAIGFIDLISKTPIDFTKLMEVKTLSFEIVESICEMSILEIKEKQRILDLSKSGMRLLITDKELIEAMLHRPQFTFDIIIKHQAPITVLGWIRMKKKMDDGTLQVGLKIQGETNRQDQMLRYLEFIKSLARTHKGEK